MAKLYYKYGAMNSSKTANLLMVVFNYESEGKKVLCLKSSLDTRGADGVISSRVAVTPHPCQLVSPSDSICKLVSEYMSENGRLSAVLVDESQFLTRAQVKELSIIADTKDVPVLCYGLKNTYMDGELFEGSAALLYYADSIEEIKTICKYCNRKAIMNLLLVNGQPCYSGESSVVVGDVKATEKYFVQTCRYHYYHPILAKKRR